MARLWMLVRLVFLGSVLAAQTGGDLTTELFSLKDVSCIAGIISVPEGGK